MVESVGLNRGSPCGSCGYRNRSGSNTCSLCGAYLYERAVVQEVQRACTGVLPTAPLPAAQPSSAPAADAAAAGRKAAPIALDEGGELYPASTAPAKLGAASATLSAPEAEHERDHEHRHNGHEHDEPAAPDDAAHTPRLARAARPERPERMFARTPDELSSDLLQERLRRERATRRAWTAAAIAFVTATALGVPGSLHPLSLLLNGTGAVLYGFPVGYVCSRRALGLVPGAALGTLAGTLYAIPLALLFALFLGVDPVSCTAQVIRGALSGLVPGAWAGRRVRG